METDTRINAGIGFSVGGHAGHGYVALDGKLLDIMNEVANYQAKFESGSTIDPLQFAVDNIVAYHNNAAGHAVPVECCYPLGSLTDAERERSDEIWESMVGAIFYHEFGHYYLLFFLDRVRSSLDFTGLVSYSSVSEDDADFIAGVLSAKAGHDPQWGQFTFDLMTYYIGQGMGQFPTFSAVTNNAVVQFGSSSNAYSPLAIRKVNFQRGYDAF